MDLLCDMEIALAKYNINLKNVDDLLASKEIDIVLNLTTHQAHYETIKKTLNTNNAIGINSINEALNYTLNKVKKDEVLFIIGSHFFAPTLSNRYKNCFAIDK